MQCSPYVITKGYLVREYCCLFCVYIMKNTESNSELLTKIAERWTERTDHTFEELSTSVLQTHQTAQAGAIRAVNQMATLRNWLIGCYIVEYEQKGSDRAKYGDRLLKRLEERVNTKGLNVTLFQVSRLFYNYYPQIGNIIYATMTHKLPQEQIYATPSHKFMTPGKDLLGKLSFSHIREIMGNSMHTCLITKRMRCTMVIILLSAFCYVPIKVRKWWNMPLPVWTTDSLSQPICFNYLTRKSLRCFCWMKWKAMTFLVRIRVMIEEYLFLRTKPSQNLFKFASLNLKRNELCQ